MLTKCIKWDFKALMHLFAALAVSLVLAIVSVAVLPKLADRILNIPVYGFGFFSLVVAVFICSYACLNVLVYTIKTLFEKPSYQYHSVPVKTSQLMLSKILVGAFYFMCIATVLVINIEMMLIGIDDGTSVVTFFNEVVKMVHRLLLPQVSVSQSVIVFLFFLCAVLGMMSIQVFIIFIGAVSNLPSLQLMGKVKYLIGFICQYVIFQVFNLLMAMVFGNVLFDISMFKEGVEVFEQSGQITADLSHQALLTIVFMFASALVILTGFYLFSKNRMTKHLNLV